MAEKTDTGATSRFEKPREPLRLGRPGKETRDRIVENYGLSESYGILGAIRMIMIGNAYGIPWSSVINRCKVKPDKRSSLLYENRVIILGSNTIPFAIVHSLAASLLRLKIIDFQSRQKASI